MPLSVPVHPPGAIPGRDGKVRFKTVHWCVQQY